MVSGPLIRDLLDSLARAMPDGGPARDRVRDETLDLLVAIFGPPEGEPDSALQWRITRAADAILAERSAIPAGGAALADLSRTGADASRSGPGGQLSRRR
jgi:hypothetical protein